MSGQHWTWHCLPLPQIGLNDFSAEELGSVDFVQCYAESDQTEVAYSETDVTVAVNIASGAALVAKQRKASMKLLNSWTKKYTAKKQLACWTLVASQ